jgi:SAM-dependent methyltransferase
VVRYVLAALALKAFSTNATTKALYRKIGNMLGQERRKKGNIDHYVRRGNLVNDLCDKYGAIKTGDRVFELGTGWVHWHSVYLRLHYDVSITMFDVWDNRQFEAFKALFSTLRSSIESGHGHDDRVTNLLQRILAVESFEELYTLLNLQYVVESEGHLDQFPGSMYDCVFSMHVLEHVRQADANQVAKEIHRILKPGGCSIHQIGIDDHLAHYDRKVSRKNYLRYSDRTWKLLFENDVQYINRLQMSDWLGIFDKAGFSLLEAIPEAHSFELLGIDPKYEKYEKEDLDCTCLTIVHRKPGVSK